jgi:hypothetical protein
VLESTGKLLRVDIASVRVALLFGLQRLLLALFLAVPVAGLGFDAPVRSKTEYPRLGQALRLCIGHLSKYSPWQPPAPLFWAFQCGPGGVFGLPAVGAARGMLGFPWAFIIGEQGIRVGWWQLFEFGRRLVARSRVQFWDIFLKCLTLCLKSVRAAESRYGTYLDPKESESSVR